MGKNQSMANGEDSAMWVPPVGASTSVSLITEAETGMAETLVREAFKDLTGKYPPKPCGYFVLVKIHTREYLGKELVTPTGEKVQLIASDVTKSEDKYQSCTGLVVAIGEGAYKGTDVTGAPKYPEGPWCRVGEIVSIPRYEGFQITFKGPKGNCPLMLLPDDKILMTLEDPEDIIATHLMDRN